MATLPDASRRYQRQQLALAALTIGATRRLWARMGTGDWDAAWRQIRPTMLAVVAAAQLRAAQAAVAYVPAVTVEVGIDPAQVATVRPAAFAGEASDGRPLGTLLEQSVVAARMSGLDTAGSLEAGGRWLEIAVQTQLSDAARGAESVALTATPAVTGYVRMLNPPSCSRCAILAGRWYRWNTGFLRHPRCDCRHIPAAEDMAGDLTTDPYEYFRSLSERDQAQVFTTAGAQAIRDGADIYQVVNARRTAAGLTTLEGVQSRRGFAAERLHGGPLPRFARPNLRRLSPEGIYELASDRDEALRLLQRHGYITGYGQHRGGVIRGQQRTA